MKPFSHALARGDDWREAVKIVGDRLSAEGASGALALIYVTEKLGEHLPDIAATLRARLNIPHWVGCTGMGILGREGEVHEGGAISVLVTPFAAGDFLPVATLLDADRAEDTATLPWVNANGPIIGLLHGDPRNGHTEEIIRRLVEKAASGAYMVGGLTPVAEAPAQVCDTPSAGGISGVLFSRNVSAAVAMSQGCLPVGPYHAITGGERGVIGELDNRPALDVLKEDVGEILSQNLRRMAGYIHVALPVGGSDTGAYTVRNLMGIDPRAKMIAVGADAGTGDRLMFVRRDPASAQKDFARSLDDLKKRIGNKRVAGAVYVSCVARGRNMFGDNDGEVRMIREALGEFPMTGFFANGEFCGSHLYGYTGVFTAFLDR